MWVFIFSLSYPSICRLKLASYILTKKLPALSHEFKSALIRDRLLLLGFNFSYGPRVISLPIASQFSRLVAVPFSYS